MNVDKSRVESASRRCKLGMNLRNDVWCDSVYNEVIVGMSVGSDDIFVEHCKLFW